MSLVWVIVGLVAMAAVLLDMFQTLLHPSGDGWLSAPFMRLIWRASKRLGHPLGSATGPLAMVSSIALWVVLMVTAGALIYVPYVPDGFLYSPGIDPSRYPDFAEALYLSLVSIATLGFGDVVGIGPWLRFAPPLEALAGFALLTAALTWFSQIEGPLVRRRALAMELRTLAETDAAGHLVDWHPSAAHATLSGLARSILEVRTDFAHHTEQFYFQETEPTMALSLQLDQALALRDAALAAQDVSVRDGGQQLRVALEKFAHLLASEFVDTDGAVASTLDAYRTEHSR